MVLALLLLSLDPGGKAADGPLRWSRFTWHAVSAGGHRLEKAALLIPATIAGLPGEHHLQLDTGAHLNLLHGGAVADVEPAYAASLAASASLTGMIAGASIANERFTVLRDYRAIFTRGERTPVIGTIGLPFLEHRLILFDYPRTRLTLLDADRPLLPAILQKTKFSPLDYRNGKIYLPVSVDGQTRSEYFFDTGASLFALMTTEQEWRRLTRRAVDDPKNVRYTLPSWDDTWLETVGAPMIGTLGIGPVSAKGPMVFFINDARFQVDRMPRTRGIVGNALLARDYAI